MISDDILIRRLFAWLHSLGTPFTLLQQAWCCVLCLATICDSTYFHHWQPTAVGRLGDYPFKLRPFYHRRAHQKLDSFEGAAAADPILAMDRVYGDTEVISRISDPSVIDVAESSHEVTASAAGRPSAAASAAAATTGRSSLLTTSNAARVTSTPTRGGTTAATTTTTTKILSTNTATTNHNTISTTTRQARAKVAWSKHRLKYSAATPLRDVKSRVNNDKGDRLNIHPDDLTHYTPKYVGTLEKSSRKLSKKRIIVGDNPLEVELFARTDQPWLGSPPNSISASPGPAGKTRSTAITATGRRRRLPSSGGTATSSTRRPKHSTPDKENLVRISADDIIDIGSLFTSDSAAEASYSSANLLDISKTAPAAFKPTPLPLKGNNDEWEVPQNSSQLEAEKSISYVMSRPSTVRIAFPKMKDDQMQNSLNSSSVEVSGRDLGLNLYSYQDQARPPKEDEVENTRRLRKLLKPNQVCPRLDVGGEAILAGGGEAMT